MPDETDDPQNPAASPAVPGAPAALARFRSCRWRRDAQDGVAEHCGHRDVLPIAGTGGFNAEAWCPDCTFYKLRRTPRKRDDY